MIVKQQGNRVYTCPIAGTRKRGADAEEDALLRDELLQDEKERAEHVMLVDLARNDMGRISEFGTVKVTQFMEVQNYSHVMHIVSMVEGRKKGEFHPLDLVSSMNLKVCAEDCTEEQPDILIFPEIWISVLQSVQ